MSTEGAPPGSAPETAPAAGAVLHVGSESSPIVVPEPTPASPAIVGTLVAKEPGQVAQAPNAPGPDASVLQPGTLGPFENRPTQNSDVAEAIAGQHIDTARVGAGNVGEVHTNKPGSALDDGVPSADERDTAPAQHSADGALGDTGAVESTGSPDGSVSLGDEGKAPFTDEGTGPQATDTEGRRGLRERLRIPKPTLDPLRSFGRNAKAAITTRARFSLRGRTTESGGADDNALAAPTEASKITASAAASPLVESSAPASEISVEAEIVPQAQVAQTIEPQQPPHPESITETKKQLVLGLAQMQSRKGAVEEAATVERTAAGDFEDVLRAKKKSSRSEARKEAKAEREQRLRGESWRKARAAREAVALRARQTPEALRELRDQVAAKAVEGVRPTAARERAGAEAGHRMFAAGSDRALDDSVREEVRKYVEAHTVKRTLGERIQSAKDRFAGDSTSEKVRRAVTLQIRRQTKEEAKLLATFDDIYKSGDADRVAQAAKDYTDAWGAFRAWKDGETELGAALAHRVIEGETGDLMVEGLIDVELSPEETDGLKPLFAEWIRDSVNEELAKRAAGIEPPAEGSLAANSQAVSKEVSRDLGLQTFLTSDPVGRELAKRVGVKDAYRIAQAFTGTEGGVVDAIITEMAAAEGSASVGIKQIEEWLGGRTIMARVAKRMGDESDIRAYGVEELGAILDGYEQAEAPTNDPQAVEAFINAAERTSGLQSMAIDAAKRGGQMATRKAIVYGAGALLGTTLTVATGGAAGLIIAGGAAGIMGAKRGGEMGFRKRVAAQKRATTEAQRTREAQALLGEEVKGPQYSVSEKERENEAKEEGWRKTLAKGLRVVKSTSVGGLVGFIGGALAGTAVGAVAAEVAHSVGLRGGLPNPDMRNAAYTQPAAPGQGAGAAEAAVGGGNGGGATDAVGAEPLQTTAGHATFTTETVAAKPLHTTAVGHGGTTETVATARLDSTAVHDVPASVLESEGIQQTATGVRVGNLDIPGVKLHADGSLWTDKGHHYMSVRDVKAINATLGRMEFAFTGDKNTFHPELTKFLLERGTHPKLLFDLNDQDGKPIITHGVLEAFAKNEEGHLQLNPTITYNGPNIHPVIDWQNKTAEIQIDRAGGSSDHHIELVKFLARETSQQTQARFEQVEFRAAGPDGLVTIHPHIIPDPDHPGNFIVEDVNPRDPQHPPVTLIKDFNIDLNTWKATWMGPKTDFRIDPVTGKPVFIITEGLANSKLTQQGPIDIQQFFAEVTGHQQGGQHPGDLHPGGSHHEGGGHVAPLVETADGTTRVEHLGVEMHDIHWQEGPQEQAMYTEVSKDRSTLTVGIRGGGDHTTNFSFWITGKNGQPLQVLVPATHSGNDAVFHLPITSDSKYANEQLTVNGVHMTGTQFRQEFVDKSAYDHLLHALPKGTTDIATDVNEALGGGKVFKTDVSAVGIHDGKETVYATIQGSGHLSETVSTEGQGAAITGAHIGDIKVEGISNQDLDHLIPAAQQQEIAKTLDNIRFEDTQGGRVTPVITLHPSGEFSVAAANNAHEVFLTSKLNLSKPQDPFISFESQHVTVLNSPDHRSGVFIYDTHAAPQDVTIDFGAREINSTSIYGLADQQVVFNPQNDQLTAFAFNGATFDNGALVGPHGQMSAELLAQYQQAFSQMQVFDANRQPVQVTFLYDGNKGFILTDANGDYLADFDIHGNVIDSNGFVHISQNGRIVTVTIDNTSHQATIPLSEFSNVQLETIEVTPDEIQIQYGGHTITLSGVTIDNKGEIVANGTTILTPDALKALLTQANLNILNEFLSQHEANGELNYDAVSQIWTLPLGQEVRVSIDAQNHLVLTPFGTGVPVPGSETIPTPAPGSGSQSALPASPSATPTHTPSTLPTHTPESAGHLGGGNRKGALLAGDGSGFPGQEFHTIEHAWQIPVIAALAKAGFDYMRPVEDVDPNDRAAQRRVRRTRAFWGLVEGGVTGMALLMTTGIAGAVAGLVKVGVAGGSLMGVTKGGIESYRSYIDDRRANRTRGIMERTGQVGHHIFRETARDAALGGLTALAAAAFPWVASTAYEGSMASVGITRAAVGVAAFILAGLGSGGINALQDPDHHLDQHPHLMRALALGRLRRAQNANGGPPAPAGPNPPAAPDQQRRRRGRLSIPWRGRGPDAPDPNNAYLYDTAAIADQIRTARAVLEGRLGIIFGDDADAGRIPGLARNIVRDATVDPVQRPFTEGEVLDPLRSAIRDLSTTPIRDDYADTLEDIWRELDREYNEGLIDNVTVNGEPGRFTHNREAADNFVAAAVNNPGLITWIEQFSVPGGLTDGERILFLGNLGFFVRGDPASLGFFARPPRSIGGAVPGGMPGPINTGDLRLDEQAADSGADDGGGVVHGRPVSPGTPVPPGPDQSGAGPDTATAGGTPINTDLTGKGGQDPEPGVDV